MEWQMSWSAPDRTDSPEDRSTGLYLVRVGPLISQCRADAGEHSLGAMTRGTRAPSGLGGRTGSRGSYASRREAPLLPGGAKGPLAVLEVKSDLRVAVGELRLGWGCSWGAAAPSV